MVFLGIIPIGFAGVGNYIVPLQIGAPDMTFPKINKAGFLLQYALQGWCPPTPFLRKRGVRTAREINQEKTALRILRGDFQPTSDASDAFRQAGGHS